MSDNELDYTTTACGKCGTAPRQQEGMVACDCCNKWFHYACVGVTDAVKKEKRWYCNDVGCQAAAKEYQVEKAKKSRRKKDTIIPTNPEESDASSVRSSVSQLVPSVKERIEAMEKEQQRLEQEWEAEKIIRQKEMEFRNALRRKKWLEEQELRKQELQWEAEMRDLELQEKSRELEQQLKVKQDHLRSVQEMENNYQERMSVIDQQLGKMKMGRSEKSGSVPNPFEGTSGQGPLNQSTPKRNSAGYKPLKKKPNKRPVSDSESSDEYGDESVYKESNEEDGTSAERSNFEAQRSGHGRSDGLGQQHFGPTRAQLAARHGIGKHLPAFSGRPEDWPLFYAAYKSSTEACGFSDIDNLSRLQQCLKGNALDLVRGQLLLPKSVPRVIQKLRQHFGRPELLLQSHLDRIQKLDPLKPNNLRGFIPFGNAVEQLCEHIEAAELKEHLVNPLLIKDLVKKLPDAEKRQWIEYKRGKRKVTLRTFTNFLSRIAEDACEANVDVDLVPSGKAADDSSGRKAKGRGALYSHFEGDSASAVPSNQRKLRSCKVCGRTDHRLRYCEDFKKLPHVERVAMVDRDKLCILCLGEHGGQCRFKFRCNVGDCREAHNPLIHPGLSNPIIGMSAHIRTNNPVMFRIIPVELYCGESKLTALAFLDEGASVTLIEGNLADRLGIVGVEEKLTINWTSDVSRVEKNSRRMNVWASAVGSGEKILLRTVRTVGRLMLPRQKLDGKELARPSYAWIANRVVQWSTGNIDWTKQCPFFRSVGSQTGFYSRANRRTVQTRLDGVRSKEYGHRWQLCLLSPRNQQRGYPRSSEKPLRVRRVRSRYNNRVR